MSFPRLMTLVAFALAALSACAQTLHVDRIKLPPGFRIEVWARLDNARAMTLGADHTLFVGSRSAGRVSMR